MAPKHDNPQYKRHAANGEEYSATAPYNFIPLPAAVRLVEEPLPGHDSYLEGHTGYFDCDLTTLTPLYTRTALEPAFFAEWGDNIRKLMADPDKRAIYAQFFHVDAVEQPLIPGSTLRGMARSLIEIASSGKMLWVTDKKLFFRSVDDSAIGLHYRGRMTEKSAVEGGMLFRKGHRYFIRRCEVARVDHSKLGGPDAVFAKIGRQWAPKWQGAAAQHRQVWVTLSESRQWVENIVFADPSDPAYEKGILVITGYLPPKRDGTPKKKKEFVFLELADPEKIEVPVAMLDRFHDEDQITQWQEIAFPTDKPGSNARKRPGMLRSDDQLGKGGDPVFYLAEAGELVFFGRARMFRLPYDHSPLDMVPAALRKHLDATGKEVFDLAEAIFGYVPEKGANGKRKSSRAGRVYFGDAKFAAAAHGLWLSDAPVTPKILGSPKPTAFQHYLVQNREQGHNPDEKDHLAHFGTPTPSQTTVRGHKLYWHKRSSAGVEADFKETGSMDWGSEKQHTQIRPVQKGVKFTFRVHFENLRDHELGALIWALTLPSVDGAVYRHKLGMGKALGLGSAAIDARLILTQRGVTTLSAQEREEPEPKGRYEQLFAGNDWHRAEREQAEGQQARFLAAFAEFVVGQKDLSVFARDPRIRLLLTMLAYPGPDPAATATLGLPAFKERPVLPTPDHIADPLQSPPERRRTSGRDGGRNSGRGSSGWHEEPRQTQPSLGRTGARSSPRVVQQPARPVERPPAQIQPGAKGLALEEALKGRFAGETPAAPANQPAAGEQAQAEQAVIPDATRTPDEPNTVDAVKRGMLVKATVVEVRFDAVGFEVGLARLPASMPDARVTPPASDLDELKQRFPIGESFMLWVLGVNKRGRVQLAMEQP